MRSDGSSSARTRWSARRIICLLANGHALLEGVPGLGKTMLVRTIAEVLDCAFNRIQFTPDLMPADIMGTNILVEEEGGRQFRFQPGPIFANLVLADEINRATPKTQSALLEAMQEQQVSVARQRYKLEPPFFVLATQNPLEMEGTYPLPEAQLDRFLFKLWVPFPAEEDLVAIMDRTTGSESLTVEHVRRRGAEIVAMQRLARSVPIAPHVTAYAVAVLAATHPDHDRARRSWCASTCATAARRAAPRRSCWRARSTPSWTAASTWPSTTSAPSPCPRSAIASSATSRARPRASRSDAIVRAVLDAVAPPTVD